MLWSDGNGCSGGETDGGCFSDEVHCGSCGGNTNVGGNEVNRGCGCRGEIEGGGWGVEVDGGDIKDEADVGDCGGEVDRGGVVDGKWQLSVNWKFSFSWLKFLIAFVIFEANLVFPFSIKGKWSL